jgi:hypothetical protein
MVGASTVVRSAQPGDMLALPFVPPGLATVWGMDRWGGGTNIGAPLLSLPLCNATADRQLAPNMTTCRVQGGLLPLQTLALPFNVSEASLGNSSGYLVVNMRTLDGSATL